MSMWQDSVQNILDTAIRNNEAAGISVLIQQEEKVPVCFTAGWADKEGQRRILRGSIFRLYSQTKPITAAAVMLLMQRGVIDLADPVSRYLPGFAGQRVLSGNSTVPTEREVTLYDLLSMTAGLSYPGDDEAGRYAARVFDENQLAMDRGEPGLDTVAFANALGGLPLAFQPGREFRYSTCADVLGAVVEVASGRSFAEFLREEFFVPLGMADTDFYVPESKRSRLVTCYKHTDKRLEPWTGTHLNCGRYDRMPAFASGGAGLVSTLDDYLRFALMLRNEGRSEGHSILTPAVVHYMTAPQLTEAQRRTYWDSLSGYSYGKLMRVGMEPGQGKGLIRKDEYGWDGWLGTYFANFPHEKLTILLMQNVTDAGTTAVVRKVRNVILSET